MKIHRYIAGVVVLLLSGANATITAGVSFKSANQIWVTSYFTDEIYRFDQNGEFQQKYTDDFLSGPEGLAFGPDGKLWVASRNNSLVLGLSFNGELDDIEVGIPELDEPTGIAFGLTGNLYVACAGNGRIVECTLEGDFVRSIGAGSGMSAPNQIVFGPEGHLFAADSATDLVYEFDPSGTLIRSFGGGELGAPIGIARALAGTRNYWVTSIDDDAVDCLDSEGAVIATFSHASLDGPRQLTHGPDGFIYVASDVNDRVVVFDPIVNQFVKEIGVGSGLNGVGGIAIVPDSINLRFKGRIAHGNEFEKVNQSGYLQYAPGSGILMIGFNNSIGAPSLESTFESEFWVLNGIEQANDTTMLVSCTAVSEVASDIGIAHCDLTLIGKRNGAGVFRIKEVKGTLHRSGFERQAALKVAGPPPQSNKK